MCSTCMTVPDGSSENTYGRCAHLEELLNLAVGLREEVGGLGVSGSMTLLEPNPAIPGIDLSDRQHA